MNGGCIIATLEVFISLRLLPERLHLIADRQRDVAHGIQETRTYFIGNESIGIFHDRRIFVDSDQPILLGSGIHM